MIKHSVRIFQHQVTHNNIDQLPPASSFINNKKGPHVKLKSLSLKIMQNNGLITLFFKGHTKGLVTRQDTTRTGKKRSIK